MNPVNVVGSISLNPSMDMSANSSDVNSYLHMGTGPSEPSAQCRIRGTENNIPSTVYREVVHLSKCVLYPPDQYEQCSSPEKICCETVFVGGLPDNATADIIEEIFLRCGEISTIRMSEKNFCHIIFDSESYVENALAFSGYYMKIGNKDDDANAGRLLVEHAEVNDDQYEFDGYLRSIEPCEWMEQESSHPPNLPPVIQYSDLKAAILAEKLVSEETFQRAIIILLTWLEKGACNERNASYFYSMIQIAKNHVRRLVIEKFNCENRLNRAELMMEEHRQGLLVKFNEIGKVFSDSNLEKVWDHFTDAQRKDVVFWKEEFETYKTAHVEGVNVCIEDETDNYDASKIMDVNESTVPHQFRMNRDLLKQEVIRLRKVNYNLRFRLQATRSELQLVRSLRKQEKIFSDRKIVRLRQTLQILEEFLHQKKAMDMMAKK